MLKSTKIIIAIGCIGFVLTLLNTFTTQYVNTKNMVITEGHFSSITYINNRGIYTYSIYIIESNKPFITGENSSHCFVYMAFKNDVKKGDPIKIYTCKNSYFTDPEVVGLIAGKWEYMPLDCVNKQVDTNKVTITIRSAFLTGCLTAGLIGLIAKFKSLRAGLRVINNS
jgi:hypothetical protein